MLDAVKKQWKVLRRDWIVGYIATLVGGAAGIAVMMLLMLEPEAKHYVAMGTVIGGLLACVFILFTTGMGFGPIFSLEVGFGCTRKHFFVSYYLVNLAYGLLDIPILAGICILEQALYSRLYRDCTNGMELLPWLPLLGGALCLGLTLAGVLAALVIMRFGRPARLGIWLVWMAVVLLLPELVSAAEDVPDSAFGWAGRQLLRLAGMFSAAQWIGFGIGAWALCLWLSWRMTCRQQVNG